jgi:DNA repair exonuclease SbcCD ATPase subunit
MISLKSIEIFEFRGIRKLSINFKEKNFAIYGPNGTGKSGVVEAIEFALTGNISRLSSKENGEVSIREHAPHVDSREHPEKAKVVITVNIPNLKEVVRIERNVLDPLNPIYTPESHEIGEVMKKYSEQADFVLTRREIIQYILSTPGDRAREIQALLKLDEVEYLRDTLSKLEKSKRRDLETLQGAKKIVLEQLKTAVGINEYSDEKLIEVVNIRRKILNLSPIDSLLEPTMFFEPSQSNPDEYFQKIRKTEAINDINNLQNKIDYLNSQTSKEGLFKIVIPLNLLNSDPLMVKNVSREQFLKLAIDILGDENCPLCDTKWKMEELKEKIQLKLRHFEEIAKTKVEIEKLMEPVINDINEISAFLTKLRPQIPLLKMAGVEAVEKYLGLLGETKKQLENFLPVEKTIESLSNISSVPTEIREIIVAVQKEINLLPDISEEDSARQFLISAQRHTDNYRSILLQLKRAEEEMDVLAIAYDSYVKISTEVLEDIFAKVENSFGELYGEINAIDEKNFKAQLVSSAGKLGLDVDFFGRGFFPPGAYHSEGHQDSMGICIYLSLMKYLQGEAFSLTVLDDVMMSVDYEHRSKMASVFKKYFPATQFIITTHDKNSVDCLKEEGLVDEDSVLEFSGWNIENGPTLAEKTL